MQHFLIKTEIWQIFRAFGLQLARLIATDFALYKTGAKTCNRHRSHDLVRILGNTINLCLDVASLFQSPIDKGPVNVNFEEVVGIGRTDNYAAKSWSICFQQNRG